MKKIVIPDTGDFRKTTELCIKYDLGVEIDIERPEYYSMNNPNEINEIMDGYKNVEISSIHGCFEDLNFWSTDNLIRNVTIKRFKYAYEISRKFGCKNIVLNNSYTPYRTPSLALGINFWFNFLKNKETIFYIRNTIDHSPVVLNDLVNGVNQILNKDNLKICLDIGFANIYSKIKLTEWIEKVNQNIGFVYLSNNDGETNERIGLNNGKINMAEICSALEQYCPNAIWGIMTSEYEDSIEWLIENKFLK
jgi:sugar phosphate isomerase/epimerase